MALVSVAGVPAEAVVGPEATAAYGFVAKLEIGVPGTDDARSCSGALVRPRVVLTARDCLVTVAHPDPAAGSALAIKAIFRTAGSIPVVDVRSDVAPGLSLAILARPAQVAAVAFAEQAPAAGDELTATGFGRTSEEWIPDQPHTAALTVRQAGSTGLELVPTSGVGLCRGDAGAPVTGRLPDGRLQLAGVVTGSAQRGCLGSTDTSGDVTAVSAINLASLPTATTDSFDQLTLSPTDSGRAPVAGAGFGTAVATGDFNKDGFRDIAVGAPTDKTGTNRDVASGTVTVFSGGANGPGTGKVLFQTAFGALDEAGDLFGTALATGDFNKDGFDDLAIGTPGEQVGTIKTGTVAVFSGSATGFGNAKGIDQVSLGRQNLVGDEFGTALAAGDFNGDGFADLAIGAPGKIIGSARSGEVSVLRGSSTGLLSASPWIVDQAATAASNEPGDLFGAALAAGNVLGAKTGTVFADLVVGVPGEAPNSDPQSGMITVIPGSTNGPVSGGISISQTGNAGVNEAGDRFGAALAVGDFDKDGWSDVAIGLPGEAPRTDPQSGTATVIPGGNTTVGKGYPLEERGVSESSNQSADQFGSAFASGDVNGDGYADLLVGAQGRAGNAGVVYSYLGGAVTTTRLTSLTPGALITQKDVYGTDEPNDRLSAAIALGDLNKDGKADAVVGSPGEGAPGEPNAGMVITLSRVTGAS